MRLPGSFPRRDGDGHIHLLCGHDSLAFCIDSCMAWWPCFGAFFSQPEISFWNSARFWNAWHFSLSHACLTIILSCIWLFWLPQEKVDHVGIAALIIGTPLTAAMVGGAMHDVIVWHMGHKKNTSLEIWILFSCWLFQSSRPEGDMTAMLLFALLIIGAALMKPLIRTLAFVFVGAALFFTWGAWVTVAGGWGSTGV